MATIRVADNYWEIHERKSHRECLDGVCGECHGRRETEVECDHPRCHDTHYHECEHCYGKGTCQVDGNAVLREIQAARDELDALMFECCHELSREGFTAAYRQMFGREPNEADVDAWWSNVQEVAHRADRSLPLPSKVWRSDRGGRHA